MALSAAERQRLRYQRRAVGRAVVPVEIELGAVADALVDAGLLQAWDCDDRAKVADALSHAVEVWSLTRENF